MKVFFTNSIPRSNIAYSAPEDISITVYLTSFYSHRASNSAVYFTNISKLKMGITTLLCLIPTIIPCPLFVEKPYTPLPFS